MSNESTASSRPYVVLATCCLSLLLVTMDVTIVNVALPAIRQDLRASVAGLQWSIDGYTVVVACFLMFAGSMGDRHGRRRTFQLGLALFSRRVAPVQPRAVHRSARRLPGRPGARRGDAQPRGDVDHREHVHRPARTGPRDRRVGRGLRSLDGGRARRRRGPHGARRVAIDLLDQRADRPRSRSPSRRASSPSREPSIRGASTPWVSCSS